MFGIKSTEAPVDRTAALITARYESARADSQARVSASTKRREHYRNTTCRMPVSDVRGRGSVQQQARHDLRVSTAHQSAVKLVGRFMAELPQNRVVPRQETEQERWRAEAIELMLAGIYSDCKALVEFQSAAWHCSMLGAAVLRVGWNADRNMPYVQDVKPEHVFIKLAAGDGSMWQYLCYGAERTAESIGQKYGRAASEFTPDRTSEDGQTQFCTLIDYWDDDMHYVVAGGQVLKSEANPFGFIPYVLIRNVGPKEYVWGLSDQEYFEGLAEYYNTMLSQHADVISRFSNPPIHARQTGLRASEVRDIFRDGGVIATTKDNADVKVITTSGAPPEFQNQAQRIRDLLGEATFSGPNGGVLSGTAVQELRAAQDALLGLKRASWACGQETINEYLLRIVEKFATGPIRFQGVIAQGLLSRSFYMTLDDNFEMPSEDDALEQAATDPSCQGLTDAQILDRYQPKDSNYKRLIDTFYATQIIWNNRTAKEDPQYRLMLLNFFAQGAKSLRTLLEETGCEDAEREIERIKQEARDMPWLRSATMQAQAQQNTGMQGGGTTQPANMFPQQGGGDPYDQYSQALNGSEGTYKPVGAVQGVPNGAA